MAASLITLPFRPVINLRGGLEAGAILEVFATGTTTPVSIYSDDTLTTPLANPLEADAFGAFPTVYYDDTTTVRVRVKQANGTVLSDTDPYVVDFVPATTINTYSGTTHTLGLADQNAVARFTSGSAVTLTIPPDSTTNFPVGTFVEVYQAGAGDVTIAAGSGVTLNVRGAFTKTAGQYAVGGIRKEAANTWYMTGDLA